MTVAGYRVRPEALGEKDTDVPSTADAGSLGTTSLKSQGSCGDGLSQGSSTTHLSQQTLSQDVRMGDADESDEVIEDFDDDIIW